MSSMSSHLQMRELCEIRKLLTRKREQILEEMEPKKSITKKQCQQWIHDLCDLVISYDTNHTNQPIIELVDIDHKEHREDREDTEERPKSAATPSLPLSDLYIKPNQNQPKETASVGGEESAPKTGSGDQSSHKVEPRFKGVIRGMESIEGRNWDSDWESNDSDFETKKRKTTTTTRQTRSGAKTKTIANKANKAKNTKTDNKSEKPSDLWSSDGQVLGGDPAVEARVQTPEELRQLMAKRTEERLAQLETRGAKGVVRLPGPAPADRGDGLSPLDHYSNSGLPLRWKM